MSSTIKIKRAIISVSDKNGIEDFAKKLHDFGVEILSTGGTAALLKKAGLPVKDVSAHTGFPEIMDGRVKTLHPKIHGGLLARRNEETHRQAMNDHNIDAIDMLVVNLYPFVETVQGGKSFEDCIENIDIGGPAMIRASAKNHDFVTVITDPSHYNKVLTDMAAHEGAVTAQTRKELAAAAFSLTAAYDSAIAGWLNGQIGETAPRHVSFAGTLKQILRYGENPHQSAALYITGDARPGAAHATQLQGKELSYNNINDTDAAFELVAEFDAPAVAIIKHANPCGVAVAQNTFDAYKKALACDPVSAFGGIIALNRALDKNTAQVILELFVEVIIAPSVDTDALPLLQKKNNIRVLITGAMPKPGQKIRIVKPIGGGLLVQDSDWAGVTEKDLKIVTARAPTEKEIADMLFAFRVAKHVKSNAIVYAKDLATVGIGAGQMSRVDSSRIAAWKMRNAKEDVGGEKSINSSSHLSPLTSHLSPLTSHLVVASDAFFPFADGLISAAEAGVTAVIQPGGSIRDEEVIKAANERHLAMVFTGIRHFRH